MTSRLSTSYRPLWPCRWPLLNFSVNVCHSLSDTTTAALRCPLQVWQLSQGLARPACVYCQWGERVGAGLLPNRVTSKQEQDKKKIRKRRRRRRRLLSFTKDTVELQFQQQASGGQLCSPLLKYYSGLCKVLCHFVLEVVELRNVVTDSDRRRPYEWGESVPSSRWHCRHKDVGQADIYHSTQQCCTRLGRRGASCGYRGVGQLWSTALNRFVTHLHCLWLVSTCNRS